MMALKYVALLNHPGSEGRNMLLMGDRNSHKGDDILAQSLRIDIRMVSFDDATRLELFNSLHHGGSGKIHFLGNFCQMTSTVTLEDSENFCVNGI